ncbi:MAG: hypothetical protein ACR2PX_14530, partial [Endozoicomonas sp.]|uniref:hypothetical protein n=1 Tax=Endozoicomonas sp. TaxID=1892382 RepID=UPI003D9AC680
MQQWHQNMHAQGAAETQQRIQQQASAARAEAERRKTAEQPSSSAADVVEVFEVGGMRVERHLNKMEEHRIYTGARGRTLEIVSVDSWDDWKPNYSEEKEPEKKPKDSRPLDRYSERIVLKRHPVIEGRNPWAARRDYIARVEYLESHLNDIDAWVDILDFLNLKANTDFGKGLKDYVISKIAWLEDQQAKQQKIEAELAALGDELDIDEDWGDDEDLGADLLSDQTLATDHCTSETCPFYQLSHTGVLLAGPLSAIADSSQILTGTDWALMFENLGQWLKPAPQVTARAIPLSALFWPASLSDNADLKFHHEKLNYQGKDHSGLPVYHNSQGHPIDVLTLQSNTVMLPNGIGLTWIPEKPPEIGVEGYPDDPDAQQVIIYTTPISEASGPISL